MNEDRHQKAMNTLKEAFLNKQLEIAYENGDEARVKILENKLNETISRKKS